MCRWWWRDEGENTFATRKRIFALELEFRSLALHEHLLFGECFNRGVIHRRECDEILEKVSCGFPLFNFGGLEFDPGKEKSRYLGVFYDIAEFLQTLGYKIKEQPQI